MEYERYQPKYSRPAGMGAFFDYGMAVAKLYAPKIQSGRASPAEGAPAGSAAEQAAEQRWDSEGGNSQTRTARRQSATSANAHDYSSGHRCDTRGTPAPRRRRRRQRARGSASRTEPRRRLDHRPVERALHNERSLENAHSASRPRGHRDPDGFASTIEDIALAGGLAGAIDGVRVVTNAIRVRTAHPRLSSPARRELE